MPCQFFPTTELLSRQSWILSTLLCLTIVLPGGRVARAQEEELLAGHSAHGEAFNDGPRQSAYLMKGLGRVSFPTATQSPLAQQYFEQGVAQLHGFWYYEAERSFRQAAVIDADFALSYWGMAMANTGNRERAQGFIAEAVERKENATDRGRLYIESLEEYLRDEDDDGKRISKKDRALAYTRQLEKIVEDYPDDIEAKAFLALQLWQNSRADLPIVSYVAVDSILQDVFDASPMHPAHHYRIHLWDRHKPERALASAAACGPSLPAIAHMWHMPGHIYDKLHRYQDAVWQQEASARVDHAHMMRDRVLPDQIHNFAHNNEWLIRNLVKIGRARDAVALAKNMLELPRHPKYNTLEKRGSARYGRERLLLVLNSFRLWPELIAAADTVYLEATDDEQRQVERLSNLGFALAMNGQMERANQVHAELKLRQQQLEEKRGDLKTLAQADEVNPEKTESDDEAKPEDAEKAAANRKRDREERKKQEKELEKSIERLTEAQAKISAGIAAYDARWEEALKFYEESKLDNALLKAEWLNAHGKHSDALAVVEDEIEDKPGQLLPLAVKVHVLAQAGKTQAALEAFEATRYLASQADLDTPLLARLLPIAREAGLDKDWAPKSEPAADIGERPSLDQLGPLAWSPYLAPDFLVKRSDGSTLASNRLRDKPTLVIFYLGFGCLHCVEQLHEFSPRASEFRDSGIDILAISTENMDSLKKGMAAYSNPLDIPLHADPQLDVFRAFRCYDDFEGQPLHGTFLIDPSGHVLWQDISYEPFMDVDFALQESHRLLKLAGYGHQLKTPVRKTSVETAVTLPLNQ